MQIYLAKPRGFCAGVDYAIGIVYEALELFGAPVYILKEIVHNQLIVQELAEKGAHSVSSIEEVPTGGLLIFSAHGVPPEFHIIAKERGLRVIDAACPLVRKVHLEAVRFAREGFTIIYIGHEGHDEAIGVLAEAPDSIILVDGIESARRVKPTKTEKMIYLTQTTLSVNETDQIVEILKERFPHLEAPPTDDICYATTNRQLAVKELARHCELILVLGSQNSSNSQRLRESAENAGAKAYLIDSKDEIRAEWLEAIESIGITAGASAPEKLVQEVVAELRRRSPESIVTELDTIHENMYFPVPNLSKKVEGSLV
ncbi:MAG: 4-hydroxy-3-methylbut-2-enyl diphosphate reductase [Candidatus Caenarcaniphilales bacterium]|nr:4-hydroxy-3-methylbut-2-enyl diphosphate reductase [Candidatus Caenarcaniphilales bacterium]